MEISEAVIHAVQKRPALYDKTQENYSNRFYISNQWREISQELGIDELTARKKWTKMRDYFQRNHRQMTAFKPGSASDKKKKRWYLYEHMTFLLPHLSVGKTYGNLSEAPLSDHSDGNQDLEDDMLSQGNHTFSSAGSTPEMMTEDHQSMQSQTERILGSKRRRPTYRYPSEWEAASSPSNFDAGMLKTVKNVEESQTCSKAQDDEDEQYFRSLIPKMKLLDPISKMLCQVEIHQVIIKFLTQIQQRSDSAHNPPQTEQHKIENTCGE